MTDSRFFHAGRSLRVARFWFELWVPKNLCKHWLGGGLGMAWEWLGGGSGVARGWLGGGWGVSRGWLGGGSGLAWGWLGSGSGVGRGWLGGGSAVAGRVSGVARGWLGGGRFGEGWRRWHGTESRIHVFNVQQSPQAESPLSHQAIASGISAYTLPMCHFHFRVMQPFCSRIALTVG